MALETLNTLRQIASFESARLNLMSLGIDPLEFAKHIKTETSTKTGKNHNGSYKQRYGKTQNQIAEELVDTFKIEQEVSGGELKELAQSTAYKDLPMSAYYTMASYIRKTYFT